jgi:Cu/Ag efflux pump CusA
MAFGGCDVPIPFAVRGRDLRSAVVETNARVAQEVALPEGVYLQWAGER